MDSKKYPSPDEQFTRGWQMFHSLSPLYTERDCEDSEQLSGYRSAREQFDGAAFSAYIEFCEAQEYRV